MNSEILFTKKNYQMQNDSIMIQASIDHREKLFES